MKDPIVEEIRQYRMEHTRRFDSDLSRICQDLRKLEKELGDRVVELQPRRLESTIDHTGRQDSR
uniref:Uncharacterized protein n=1 Tax=Candidatus Kentrum sp. DK TaxID=2126562 RepID=A0A450S7P9_9GAMM|nr:MAG: hypothetical protein BECKDK2373B_GA0170837_101922 [Candidatus Kentron sp. DK]